MSDATATAERDEKASPEALLAPLLRADFFLTDGRGLVTRWGARPARAFGREAEDVVGRPAFEAVVNGADGWVRYLAGEGEPPHPHVEGTAAGEDFPVELLVLPVPLSESLEMSRLLEAMAPDLTPHERLAKMGRDHPAALERVSARAEGSPWDTDRLAGLVVAYTAPEREAQAAPPPPPAVGESEERLSRLGELEHQMADLLELRNEVASLREQRRRWRSPSRRSRSPSTGPTPPRRRVPSGSRTPPPARCAKGSTIPTSPAPSSLWTGATRRSTPRSRPWSAIPRPISGGPAGRPSRTGSISPITAPRSPAW